MREYPFLHPDDEDCRELQPLRAVHRHQDNSIAAFLFIIHTVDIRNQRQIGKEGDQGLVFIIFLKLHRNRQEFINILQAGAGFECILILQLQPVLRQLQNFLGQLGHRQELYHPVQRFDHIVKLHQCIPRPAGKAEIVHRLQHPVYRYTAFCCRNSKLADCRISQTALRHIDNPR